MKTKKILSILLAFVLILSFTTSCAANNQENSSEDAINPDIEAYLSKIDPEYGYQIAEKLSGKEFMNNPELGGRTAGSDAEHKVADLLVEEMKAIGLTDVKKEAFPVDKWQFNSSELRILEPTGEEKVLKPYSYASGGTPEEGIEAELVYVGKGTKQDYEGIDVSGKIVLVDIDMGEEWWVNFPTMEAALHGAAAIINNCVGGYAQLNDDTMNAQDMVGPVTIPSLNISKNDANYLKGLLEKGPVKVNLKVDNVVEPGGTSYNIVGKIPGKNSDEMIIIGDHYDVHFWGFQDNNCAVGLTLAIAKAMIESNYQPERDIVFILHGAEEYGAINSYHDWSIGAWNQINRIHPEWAGKALAYINFELPAYEFTEFAHTTSAPELYSFLAEFAKVAPQPENCFPQGIATEGYIQGTWDDSWSYTIAGVPSMVNGGLYTDESGFFETTYHSQFDTPDTFNQDVFIFNLKFYGAMAIALDQKPLLPLDFTHQAVRVRNAIDSDAFALAECDPQPLLQELEAFESVAADKYNQLQELNHLYEMLIASEADNSDLIEKIKEVSSKTNALTLSTFKIVQDGLLKLGGEGETVIVGHERPQQNVSILSQSIEKLKENDVVTVIDELLYQIEDTWYSYHFSKEVIENVHRQLYDPEWENNRFWGIGKYVGHVNLYDVTQSLLSKYDTGGDFSKEIAVLEETLQGQKELLSKTINDEIETLQNAKAELEKIDLASLIEEVNAILNQ